MGGGIPKREHNIGVSAMEARIQRYGAVEEVGEKVRQGYDGQDVDCKIGVRSCIHVGGKGREGVISEDLTYVVRGRGGENFGGGIQNAGGLVGGVGAGG